MSKPADYYSSFNHDLLALIPPDAKTVLEIGCGEGTLCEAYRRINPGVEWLGVECHQPSAALATLACNDVYAGFVENFDGFLASDDDDPDVLVLGDILEHLQDPWNELKRVACFIKPGAQVLACIPNVQHWTIIRNLLEGKWDYADSGLMDRTHLRWFTLKSIREMFGQAGLQVFEIIGRDLFNDGYGDWLAETGLHAKPEMRAYQYLVRAIKPDVAIVDIMPNGKQLTNIVPIKPLHIHAILAEACCARPRILEPMAMLRTIPGVKCTTSHPGDVSFFPRADVVIQQRWRQFEFEQQQRILHASQFDSEFPDKLIIAEIDDDPTSPQYLHGRPFDPMPLRAVHAIQCSTEALAEVCRQYNPNVMVFENQIAELPAWGNMDSDGNILIFFGAQNRQADWAPIMPALNRVLADYGQKISVIVVHDREFYDALEPSTDRHFFPFCEYDRYRGLLRECDIALLPLEDTPFNQCKSDIKFLECAAEGVCALVGPYAQIEWGYDLIEETGIGFGFNDRLPFEEALRELIGKPHLRAMMARNAYAYVRDNRLLSQHFKQRYAWYQSLLTSKQALDYSLLERCPELQPEHSQC